MLFIMGILLCIEIPYSGNFHKFRGFVAICKSFICEMWRRGILWQYQLSARVLSIKSYTCIFHQFTKVSHYTVHVRTSDSPTPSSTWSWVASFSLSFCSLFSSLVGLVTFPLSFLLTASLFKDFKRAGLGGFAMKEQVKWLVNVLLRSDQASYHKVSFRFFPKGGQNTVWIIGGASMYPRTKHVAK